jgi:hypothetical protein
MREEEELIHLIDVIEKNRPGMLSWLSLTFLPPEKWLPSMSVLFAATPILCSHEWKEPLFPD